MASRRGCGCLGIPLSLWLTILYVAFAIYAWIDFTRTNPDGLANLGLFLVTAPITLVMIVGRGVTGDEDFMMPQGHGYFADHALYYVPAVAVTALLLWLVARATERLATRQPDEEGPPAP